MRTNKVIINIAAAAVCLLGFSGCAKDLSGLTIRFNARTRPEAPVTKTTYSGETYNAGSKTYERIDWSDGDIIVLAMNLVGSLLISALVIFPALSAMRVFKSFRAVTVCSAVVSVLCALAGILIAILAGTPVGATIVAVDMIVFVLFYLIGALTGGVR